MLRDEHFVKLCEAVDLPGLATEQRFATNDARLTNRDELEAILVPVFAARDLAAWTDVLLRHDVLAAPVTEVPDIAADPSLMAAIPIVRVPAGAMRDAVDAIGLPFSLGETRPTDARLAAPAPGEHSREVLREVGFTDADVDSYVRDGVVHEGVSSAPA